MLKAIKFQSLLSISLLACSLSACVTQPFEDSSLAADLEKVNGRIVDLENQLSKQFIESCKDSIAGLNEKVEQLRVAKASTKYIERCTNSNDAAQPKLADLDDKLLLGAIEKVRLTEEDLAFSARIDTGAVTSSVGVYNWRNFERDGKKWVKFALQAEKDAMVYEYPVYDTVKIKQTGTLTEDRIEIKLDIEMGGIKYKNQIFNLADRSHLDYQLLIGRSFLQDIAVVDVGRKNLLNGN